MKKYPLVSIVIPTRHRKELLKNALKSICQQSYHNLQIIIHDNNTPDLIESEINPNKDPRIEFYKSNEDLGMLENWKKAISYVRGDLFMRFDDDNILCKTYIENSVKYFCDYGLKVVTGNHLTTFNNKTMNSLIKDECGISRLSRNQLTYLTYYNLIDTNYSIYDYKFLVDSFGFDGIYETNLPDRYLDLRLASIINDGDALFVKSISGISRIDYRTPELNINLGRFTFDEIMKFRDISMSSQISPHDNFTLSRFYVFLKYYKSIYACKNPFFSKLISLPFLEMELIAANLNKSDSGFFSLFVYNIKIFKLWFDNPKSCYQNRCGIRFLLFIAKMSLRSLIKSLMVSAFDSKIEYDLNYWNDRINSTSFDDFIKLYKSEARPSLDSKWFDKSFL
jgi:glycosyltransferase involved in cell wall biosynthesis